MPNYLLKPVKHENFNKKYAAHKFMKTSPSVHAWVRDGRPRGSKVGLEEELPELRRESWMAAGQWTQEEGELLVQVP
jgi:G2/mitotic-specific cyclin 2